MAVLALIMTGVVLGVTVLSCVSDVRSLRIPNAHSIIVAACFFPAWLAMPEAFKPFWHYPAALGAMFVITYLMFAKGLMGGGDAKLGTALALWVGLRGLMPFVFYMALIGGVLGILSLILQKKKFFARPHPGGWVEQAQAGQSAIPYGIAISLGAWASFLHTGLIHQQIHEVLKIIH